MAPRMRVYLYLQGLNSAQVGMVDPSPEVSAALSCLELDQATEGLGAKWWTS